jgi:hypothetical protein
VSSRTSALIVACLYNFFLRNSEQITAPTRKYIEREQDTAVKSGGCESNAFSLAVVTVGLEKDRRAAPRTVQTLPLLISYSFLKRENITAMLIGREVKRTRDSAKIGALRTSPIMNILRRFSSYPLRRMASANGSQVISVDRFVAISSSDSTRENFTTSNLQTGD